MKSAVRLRFDNNAGDVVAAWRREMKIERPNISPMMTAFGNGMAEIARMRLIVACAPLLYTLEDMQKRYDVLIEALKRPEPYAPPAPRENRPRIQTRHTPLPPIQWGDGT